MRDSSGAVYHGVKSCTDNKRYDQHYASSGMTGGKTTGGCKSTAAAYAQESYDIGRGNTFHDGLNYTRGNCQDCYYQGKADGGHSGSTGPSNAEPK